MRSKKQAFTTLLIMLISVCCQAKYKHKHRAHGTASYYSSKYEGKKTASGDVFTNRGYTAASNKFRLGAYVRVTNQNNGNKVYVRINDRMGNDKRVIDLTVAATEQLGFKQQGTTKVKVKVVKDRKGKRKIRKQSR